MTHSLQDIHDVLQLSLPTTQIGQWLVSANELLGAARPVDCLAAHRFDDVYQAAMAL